jgi:hypothetical protein
VIFYKSGAELPAYTPTLRVNDSAVDLSSGYTFNVTIDFPTPLVKTTGITGAASEPNLNVAWSAGELAVTPGVYGVVITATNGAGLDYKWSTSIAIS